AGRTTGWPSPSTPRCPTGISPCRSPRATMSSRPWWEPSTATCSACASLEHSIHRPRRADESAQEARYGAAVMDDATRASPLPIDDVLAGVLREALAAASPFAELDPAVREALAARATRCSFAAGDVVVRAGGVARAMYVLLVGHVQVYVEDEA